MEEAVMFDKVLGKEAGMRFLDDMKYKIEAVVIEQIGNADVIVSMKKWWLMQVIEKEVGLTMKGGKYHKKRNGPGAWSCRDSVCRCEGLAGRMR